MRNILLILFSTLLLYSCQPVFKKALGIRKIRTLSESRIAQIQDRYHVNSNFSYYVDTNYLHYLSLHFDEHNIDDKPVIKDYVQPLLAAYYFKKQTADLLIVNCNAEMRVLNLTLNKHGEMNVFPPKYKEKGSNKILLNEYLTYLKPVDAAHKIKDIETSNYDNVVIIHWSYFMNRQARIFVKQALDNLNLSKQNNLVLFVNIDNIYTK